MNDSDKYILVSFPSYRPRTSPPQYMSTDGDRVVWIPSFKQATRLTYSKAMRIRRRFVGGHILTESV